MWLIGMMGSGKTSVGRRTAELLAVPFYDTDETIVAVAGASIAEIWSAGGEEQFRRMERDAIEGAPSGVVAAAGGGAVTDPRNRETMKKQIPVIWLRARPETLARRLDTGDDRPLLTGATERVDVLREILNSRLDAYRSASTHVVDTDDRESDEIAEEVSGLWPV